MKKLKVLRLDIKDYKQRVAFLDHDLYYYERDQNFPKKTRVFNVFPKDWLIIISDLPEGRIHLESRNGRLKSSPPTAVFLPPFSIVRWELQPGNVKFIAFRSEAELPPDLQTTVFLFPWNLRWRFASAKELIALLERMRPGGIAVPMEYTDSELAKRAKALLDSTYAQDVSLKEISAKLGVRHPNMTAAFTHCYGFSPVVYRNQLRVQEAIRHMLLKGENLTDSCYEAGFGDYTRFYHQFRKVQGMSPSTFKHEE